MSNKNRNDNILITRPSENNKQQWKQTPKCEDSSHKQQQKHDIQIFLSISLKSLTKWNQAHVNILFVLSLLHFLHTRIEQSLALVHHLPQVPAPINQAGAPWPHRGRTGPGWHSVFHYILVSPAERHNPAAFPSCFTWSPSLMYHLRTKIRET